MFNDDGIDMIVGYATTEEKAKQMIEIIENIIKRAELSGETYIPEKYNGHEYYDNPDVEICFQF